MRSKILLITSLHFYQPTLDALARIQLDCDTTVVPYQNFQNIGDVYAQYAPHADAVLVSGASAKRAIELAHPRINKPIVSFQIGSDAFYRDILFLLSTNRQIDLSRVAVDFLLPLGIGYSVADFLAMDDTDSIHPLIRNWLNTIGTRDVGGAESCIMTRILELWQKKEIDLVICQYSSLVPALDALGIPNRCPFLSDNQLRSLIRKIEGQLVIKQMQDNLPAIIRFSPLQKETFSPEEKKQLHAALTSFIKANLLDCMGQDSENGVMLISSMQTIRILTDDFQVCSLSSYLSAHLSFPVAIAYGIGTTVVQALSNSQAALRESLLSGKSHLVDMNGNIIGPMGSESRMIIHPDFMPNVGAIAKRCNLSTLTIQKLINSVRSTDSDKITTQELAQRFDITIRNANRILINLVKGGVAVPVYTLSSHSRGRPVQVYALDFGIPI